MSDQMLILAAFGLAILCALAPIVLSHYLLEENRGGWL